MYNEFEHVSQEFALEVDREAARLIEIGTPPWDAVVEARKIVSRRRFERAMKVPPTNWEGSDR